MSNYTVSKGRYALTVSDHGAEIRSLKKDGTELMWQADPGYWGRTSPVLFPLVGNYWEKKSRYDGKVYEMSQHGFARDQDFELVSGADDELIFELAENDGTLEKYPFPFVLQIGYKVSEDGVEVRWTVRNPSDGDIFFSIGGHPAFNCDLSGDKLLFMKDGKELKQDLKANIIENDGSGCLSDRSKTIGLDNGVLQLSAGLFDEDALIIEDRQADSVSLVDSQGKEVLCVRFDAPLFGIWSPVGKNAPFVCIEPWYGRCDRVGFTGDLSEREYGNRLAAKEEFSVSYSIK
jgi:galactose mutarotase-like enzyme